MNGQYQYHIKVIARRPPSSFIQGIRNAKQDTRTRLWSSEFNLDGTEHDINDLRSQLQGNALSLDILDKTPIVAKVDENTETKEGKSDCVIPAELRDLKRWVCYTLGPVKPNGKRGKVPYYASGGKRRGTQGSDPDVAELVTYAEAVEAHKQQGLDGVGLAMLGDGYVALDFDGCIDDGRVAPWVLELISDTYAEISPSGKGIRAFYRGSYDNYKNHDRGVEVFCNNGFVTVTENQINNNGIADLPVAIRQKLDELRPADKQRTNNVGRTKPIDATTRNLAGNDFPYTPENVERIKKGLRSRTKADGYNGFEKWLETMFSMRTLRSLAGWPDHDAWMLLDEWSKWVNDGDIHYDEAKNREEWDKPEKKDRKLKTFASILEDAKIAPTPLPPVNDRGISAAELAAKVFPPPCLGC